MRIRRYWQSTLLFTYTFAKQFYQRHLFAISGYSESGRAFISYSHQTFELNPDATFHIGFLTSYAHAELSILNRALIGQMFRPGPWSPSGNGRSIVLHDRTSSQPKSLTPSNSTELLSAILNSFWWPVNLPALLFAHILLECPLSGKTAQHL